MTKQRQATLRVCASCEWIFRHHAACPKCGFAHYGARWVYGDAAYRYEHTQKPWREKKLTNYAVQLDKEIRESKEGCI
jgi:ribosomal protein L32